MVSKDACNVLLSASLLIFTVCQLWMHWNQADRVRDGEHFIAEMQKTSQRISRVELSLDRIQQTMKREKRIPAVNLNTQRRIRRQAAAPEWHREIRNLKRKIRRLENRIHCSMIKVNGTDSQGRPCTQHARRKMPGKVTASPVRNKNRGKSDVSTSRPTNKLPSRNVNQHASRAQKRKTVKSNWTSINTVYVAWGVTRCPESDGTSDLYSGMVASSEGSEFLCLPESFYYENPKNVSNTDRVQLHPVKYGKSMELLGPRWNRKRNYARSESEVPCAVCRHSGRSVVLVQPAASNCPTGEWQREYRGYLMASENRDKRAEFICVNINAESKSVNNGRLQSPISRLQLTQYDYEPAHSKELALACVVCLI